MRFAAKTIAVACFYVCIATTAQAQFTGFVKPVPWPVYDGTVSATRYSTPYLGDHKNNPEGSGSHTGVDIVGDDKGALLTIQSPIVAIYDGQIVRKTIFGVNSNGFGDSLVLRHQGIPDASPSGVVYSSYLHMNDFGKNPATGKEWQEGETVQRGAVIGHVGHTDAPLHLHFQLDIDYSDYARHPFAIRPFGRTENTPDSDGLVARHTLNPVRFVEAHLAPVGPVNQSPTAGFTLTASGQPTTLSSPPAATIPNLTVPSSAICNCAVVAFDGRSPNSSDSDGSVVSWQWRFDGASAQTTGNFSMNVPVGTHRIALVVTDNQGEVSTAAQADVTVSPFVTPPPVAVDDGPYSATQGTLFSLSAPGVLGNDTYPVGAQVEFLTTLPYLTNVPPFNGGFKLDFSLNPSFVGALQLQYVIHSSAGDSNLASVVVNVSPASVTRFSYRDLGLLPGYASSCGIAINASGGVTGLAQGPIPPLGSSSLRGFVYRSDTGMSDLGLFAGDANGYGQGINAAGTVVGFSSHDVGLPGGGLAGTPHAFSFTAGGGLVDIGTFGGSHGLYSFSSAYGINTSGHIAGYAGSWRDAVTNSFFQHGFLYRPETGVMVDIGSLPGSVQSFGYAINDADQVTGYSRLADAPGGFAQFHAFVYTPGQGLLDLGTLGGVTSEGRAINSQGDVVGISTLSPGGVNRAFIYRASTGVISDLGTLGGAFAEAYAINSLGWVVGRAERASPPDVVPFLYRPGVGMVELQPLVTGLPAGWRLFLVNAVNEAGQITGCAVKDATSEQHAFVLSPAGSLSWSQEGQSAEANFQVSSNPPSGRPPHWSENVVVGQLTPAVNGLVGPATSIRFSLRVGAVSLTTATPYIRECSDATMSVGCVDWAANNNPVQLIQDNAYHTYDIPLNSSHVFTPTKYYIIVWGGPGDGVFSKADQAYNPYFEVR